MASRREYGRTTEALALKLSKGSRGVIPKGTLVTVSRSRYGLLCTVAEGGYQGRHFTLDPDETYLVRLGGVWVPETLKLSL